ncbi:MAG: flagellar basal-body rod protein FlgF [Thermodesulfovibrionales bacterium]|nr:flagellar basal-body rod protein FlgF [Thermodesulfovibrionales bacterium]
MHKAIYIALSGALMRQLNMDIISQNLANVNTIGYKSEKISFNDYILPQDLTSPNLDLKVMNFHTPTVIDFSSGSLIMTSNPLNIAIDGEGFIALEGNRYTRRGDLKRDANGYLTTQSGIKILGEKGPIKLPDGKIEIKPNGTVLVDGVEVDSLKVVKFKDTTNLIKLGESIFSSNEQGTKSNAEVKQGYLETSNVNIISEMVKMITTLREYEAYQRAIQTFDESTAKVNNEMGRL